MSIITISRGSFSKGKEIAEKVAKELGYDCISRELLIKASKHFNVSEIKLARAMHDAPSIWEAFTYGKERYVAYLQDAFLRRAGNDNLVYHGLAGHFMLQDIPHVLNVRVVADLEDRIQLEMERENIGRDEALHKLERDDHDRRQWSLSVWGRDNSDPRLYDMVIHIHRFTVNDAVKLICHTVQLEQFQTTPESRKILEDSVLAADVRIKLVDHFPSIKVTARSGIVTVSVNAPFIQETQIADEISGLAQAINGVREVRVNVVPTDMRT